MLEIVGLIHAKGNLLKVDRKTSENLIEMINTRQPFPKNRQDEIENPMDMTPFLNFLDRAPSPRVIQTHLALDRLPPTLLKTAKVYNWSLVYFTAYFFAY